MKDLIQELDACTGRLLALNKEFQRGLERHQELTKDIQAQALKRKRKDVEASKALLKAMFGLYEDASEELAK